MFKDELKRARLSAYLTQKALSEKTSIPLSNIKNWECGNYLPSQHYWAILYDFFLAKTRTTPLTHTLVELKHAYLREKINAKE